MPTMETTKEVPAVITISGNDNRIFVPVELTVGDRNVGAQALLDSGATNSFIDSHFVQKHNIPVQKTSSPIKITNADGSGNHDGNIQEVVMLPTTIGDKTYNEAYYVIRLKYNMILRYSWLVDNNPIIN